MRPTPEAVIELAAKIVDLKRRLGEAQREWEVLFPEEGQVPPPPIPLAMARNGQLRPTVFENSHAAKVLTYVNHYPAKDLHPEEIVSALGISDSSVRSNLHRLVKKGLIEQRGRGHYGALTTRDKETSPEEKAS